MINDYYRGYFESLERFLLINSLSITDSGLANKAGTALVLFELSRGESFFNDLAFGFFEESMATIGNNFSYRGDLGNGMILNYLIDKKYIDADFHDLFGETHSQIENYILSGHYSIEIALDLILYISCLNKNRCLRKKLADVLSEKIQLFLFKEIVICDQLYWKIFFLCRCNFLNDKDVRLVCSETLNSKNIETDINIKLYHNFSNLSQMVKLLFYESVFKKSNPERILNNICNYKINFREFDLNLNLGRLLLLYYYQEKIPVELLFFYY